MKNINELIAEGKLAEAAAIMYDAVLGIINVGSPKMDLSREEWDKVAPELVKKMQDPTKPVPTPTPGPGDDVEVLDKKAELVVNFEVPEGYKAPKAVKKQIYVSLTYKVTAPEIEGLEPDKEVVTGKMTEDGAEETITYTEKEPGPTPPPVVEKGTLTILYEGPDKDPDWESPDPYEHEYNVGEEFLVDSPVVEGFTPDKESVSGAMVNGGIEEIVTYTKDENGGG